MTSYGILFIPKDKRLEPDINKLSIKVLNESIREEFINSERYLFENDKTNNKQAKQLARLINSTPSNQTIIQKVKKSQRDRDREKEKKNNIFQPITEKIEKNNSKSQIYNTTINTNSIIPQVKYISDSYLPSYKLQRSIVKDNSKNYNISTSIETSDTFENLNHKLVTTHAIPPPNLRFSSSAPSISLTQTINYLNKEVDSGKFFVKNKKDDYLPKLEAKPSASSFIKSTPRNWNIGHLSNSHISYGNHCKNDQTLNEFSKDDSDQESKETFNYKVYDSDNISELSALQTILQESGDLKIVSNTASNITSSSNFYINKMSEHLKWLRNQRDISTSCGNQNENAKVKKYKGLNPKKLHQNMDEIDLLSSNSRRKSLKSIGTLDSNISHTSSQQTNKSANTDKSQNISSSSKTCSKHSFQYLPLDSTSNSHGAKNSFATFDMTEGVSAKEGSRSIQSIDPNSNSIINIEHFAQKVRPNSLNLNNIATKKEVINIINSINIKNSMYYIEKIKGIANLIFYIKDKRLTSPGFQSIFTLHHIMILKATNNNLLPYYLSKQQIYTIITSYLPWAAKDVLNKLLKSFDILNTNKIYYSELIGTLCGCFSTALINLASGLEDMETRKIKWYPYLNLKFETKSKLIESTIDINKRVRSLSPYIHHLPTDFSYIQNKLHEKEWIDIRGEILIIRYLHQIFSEANGGLARKKIIYIKKKEEESRIKTINDNESSEINDIGTSNSSINNTTSKKSLNKSNIMDIIDIAHSTAKPNKIQNIIDYYNEISSTISGINDHDSVVNFKELKSLFKLFALNPQDEDIMMEKLEPLLNYLFFSIIYSNLYNLREERGENGEDINMDYYLKNFNNIDAILNNNYLLSLFEDFRNLERNIINISSTENEKNYLNNNLNFFALYSYPHFLEINKSRVYQSNSELSLHKGYVVTADMLIDGLFMFPNVLREFIRQMREFRRQVNQELLV